MKKNKKTAIIFGLIVTILSLIFVVKNYVIGNQSGFYWGAPIDIVLLLPTLPLYPALMFIPDDPIILNTIVTFGATIFFWLLVGYGIGYWMDKRK